MLIKERVGTSTRSIALVADDGVGGKLRCDYSVARARVQIQRYNSSSRRKDRAARERKRLFWHSWDFRQQYLKNRLRRFLLLESECVDGKRRPISEFHRYAEFRSANARLQGERSDSLSCFSRNSLCNPRVD